MLPTREVRRVEGPPAPERALEATRLITAGRFSAPETAALTRPAAGQLSFGSSPLRTSLVEQLSRPDLRAVLPLGFAEQAAKNIRVVASDGPPGEVSYNAWTNTLSLSTGRSAHLAPLVTDGRVTDLMKLDYISLEHLFYGLFLAHVDTVAEHDADHRAFFRQRTQALVPHVSRREGQKEYLDALSQFAGTVVAVAVDREAAFRRREQQRAGSGASYCDAFDVGIFARWKQLFGDDPPNGIMFPIVLADGFHRGPQAVDKRYVVEHLLGGFGPGGTRHWSGDVQEDFGSRFCPER